jgi:uncharacterized alkaline shock family protein YloU
MEGQARISSDILTRYAGDAALAAAGVRGLVESTLHRHSGVRVTGEGEQVSVEVHVEVEWGASLPAVGRDVQERVGIYLQRMADVSPATIDVVIDAVS